MSYFSKWSRSISEWETSYFGGFDRVLLDHPSVIVPEKIITSEPVKHGTTQPTYLRKKLLDMFLLKVATHPPVYAELEKTIYLDKENIVTIDGKQYLQIPSKSIEKALKSVIAIETEIGSLFDYYKSYITRTEYFFELPPQKEDGKGKGEGQDKSDDKDKSNDNSENNDNKDSNENEENDGSKSVKQPKELEQTKKQLRKLMNEIKVRKSFYEQNDKAISDSNLKANSKFVQMKKRNKGCNYEPNEVRLANRLLNLLDISFDPTCDKVNNLKAGKLDISKIAEIPSGNTHVYYSIEENQSTKPFSVCILADESGSMQGHRLHKQKMLLKVLYKTFSQILPSNKIFIFGHSGYSTPEIRIYNDKYFDGFEYTIDNQEDNDLNENYDGPVIEKVYERVRNQTSDNIIFISISDGYPSGHNYGGENAIQDMKRVIEKCKRDGFVTLGIGVDCGLVKEIYQYHVVVNSRTEDNMMVSNISTLVNRVVKTEFQAA